MEITKRYPAVAGTFYPNDRYVLEEMLKEFFSNVNNSNSRRQPKAIIVPHAGYIYSGQVAAHAYSLLTDYKNVILLGPSHRVYMDKIVSDTNQFWVTPLGEVALLDSNFEKNEKMHEREHCLEVQVPFLQHVLKDFKILPLLAGDVDFKRSSLYIQDLLDDNTLLVVSSDLSHFHDYDTANKMDVRTIDAIKTLDFNKVEEACGIVPIKILISIAQRLEWHPEILKYKNSGDSSGILDSVVGYSSIAFYA